MKGVAGRGRLPPTTDDSAWGGGGVSVGAQRKGVAGRGRLPHTTVDSAGAVDEKPDIAIHVYGHTDHKVIGGRLRRTLVKNETKPDPTHLHGPSSEPSR